VLRIGLPDRFVTHGSPKLLHEEVGFTAAAIAEHAVLLMLALCRHLRRASQQLRANDFSLDQLIGFDLHGKTVGILGVGRIGGVLAGILHGVSLYLFFFI
jgi:D-lactate dehydrogenase